MPADSGPPFGLAAALAADDAAENGGMPPDDRRTCWTCQSWADHAHDPLSGRRIELDEWEGTAVPRRRTG